MRTIWTFHCAGSLQFGRGAAGRVGEVAALLQARRVLVVTDPVLVKAGLCEPIHQNLSEAGLAVEVFPGGEPEPSIRAAEACIAAARHFRPDALVALGGGSNMDLAKVTAAVHTHGGTPRDYLGELKIPGPVTPLLCLPTTAGTGSEVSGGAVLTDPDAQVKIGIMSNFLRPAAAIVDPLLTVTCPPKVTADSGMDALTHAVEAFTAVDNSVFPLPSHERSVYQGRNPFGDMTAERAIHLVGQYLRRAVRDGHDLEAREGMALAATLAGLAFSNVGVAAVHALEYPIGAATHCSHGCGNGLLLAPVMQYNLPMRRKEFATIARLLGEDVAGLSEDAAAERAIAAVDQLRADVGLPGRLRDLGAREDQLRGFAEKSAAIHRILRVNPRTANADDLEQILRSAW